MINYDLLAQLATQPHPLLHIGDDLEAQIRTTPISWTGEVFTEARTVHHLLDLAGIPQRLEGHVYASDLDSRTYLLVMEAFKLRGRLDRIALWHSRTSGPGGRVGDYCTECGQRWPCDTRQMADGSFPDLEES